MPTLCAGLVLSTLLTACSTFAQPQGRHLSPWVVYQGEGKIDALRAHASQMGDWDPEPTIREWASAAAAGKEMGYAETFRVVTLLDDETWAKRNGGEKSAA